MSPEQCVSDPGLDGKADVYSLGVMLYEMLAGTLPFEAKHGFDFMAAHVRMEPRPLGTLAPEVPQEVVNLVHSMLAKAPRMRPSMETVVNILDQLRAATPGLWTTGKHTALEQPSGEIELGATMPGQSGPGLSGRSSHPSRQQLESGATVPGQSNPPSRRSKNELALFQSDPVPRPAEPAAPPASPAAPASKDPTPLPSSPVSAGVPARRSPLLPVLGLLTLAVLGVGLTRVLPSRQGVTAPPPAVPRMVKWILKSTPPGAEVVRADGQLLGTTPWESERQPGPGETVVTLRLPGWQPKSITLSHSSGLLTELHLEPAAPPAAAPAVEVSPPPASAPPKPGKTARHKTARPAPPDKTTKKPDKKDDVELLD